jgi:rod shape-determining protein MreD
MKLATVLVVLALCLAAQAVAGRLLPEASSYVDVMLVPVIWYAISGSQRSGMLVGCVAGLLEDAWFQTGAFGIGGFKKTIVGWALGGLGSRFDLNRQPGRFVFGAAGSLGDSLLDLGLRRLLDQTAVRPGPLELAIKPLLTGLLVVMAFGITRWVSGRRERRSMA